MDNQSEGLPKKLWVFWHTGFEAAPGLVKKCLASWRRHNPGWEINALNEKTYKDYIDIASIVARNPKTMNVQALAEVIRINLVSKFGGVWADATVFCCQPLDEWLPRVMTTGFFAFEKPGPDRLLSSWFLASGKDSYLTNAMCRAYSRYWSNSFPYQNSKFGKIAIERIDRVLNQNARRAGLWAHPLFVKIFRLQPYFCFQYVFYRLVATDRRSRELWERTPKITADIPHRLQIVGPLNPVSNEIKSIIDARKDPLYKLDWRRDKDVVPGCNLDYLLNSNEIEPAKNACSG